MCGSLLQYDAKLILTDSGSEFNRVGSDDGRERPIVDHWQARLSRRGRGDVLRGSRTRDAATAQPRPASTAPGATSLTLNVNGRDTPLNVDGRTTLLDALRDHAGLTGSKKGCDDGQCGACTVHADGRRTLARLTLAVQAVGSKIVPIEGLAGEGGGLHPIQQAFIDHDAFRCGY